MPWKLDESIPIYLQLLNQLKLKIVRGDYPPGETIPSVRELAAQAQVNPNTMQRALMELEREGFVVTHRGKGRMVTDDVSRIEQEKREAAERELTDCLEKLHLMGITREELLRMVDEFHPQKSVQV